MTVPPARVSVVVPLYNEGARVFALAAHLQCMRGLHEIIFADASDDGGSLSALKKLRMQLAETETKTPLRIVHCAHRGRGAQMNAGAAECGGDALLFLHADTALPQCAPQKIRACIARGIDWGWFDVRVDARAPAYRLLECLINLRARITRIATGDHAIFVRRSVFMRMRGFAEIALMEDIEFSRRLKQRARAAVLRPAVRTSARRWRRHGFARTVLLMWKLRWRYFRGESPARLAACYRDAR